VTLKAIPLTANAIHRLVHSGSIVGFVMARGACRINTQSRNMIPNKVVARVNWILVIRLTAASKNPAITSQDHNTGAGIQEGIKVSI